MPIAKDSQIVSAFKVMKTRKQMKRVMVSPWLALKDKGLDLGDKLRNVKISVRDRGKFLNYQSIAIAKPTKAEEALYAKVKVGKPLKSRFTSRPSKAIVVGPMRGLVKAVYSRVIPSPPIRSDFSMSVYERGAKKALRAWYTANPIADDGTDAGFSWSYYLSNINVNFLNTGIRITATMKAQVAHFAIGNITGTAKLTVEGLPYVNLGSFQIMFDPANVEIDLDSNNPVIRILFEGIEAGVNWALDFAESLLDAFDADIPLLPATFKADLPEFGGVTAIEVLGIRWSNDRVTVHGKARFLEEPCTTTLKYKGNFSKGTRGFRGRHKEVVVGGFVDTGSERESIRVWGRESGINSGISWSRWVNPSNVRDARVRIRCWYDARSRITVHYEIYQHRVL